MPRNRTEKTRRIVQPGWFITRASTPYNGYEQESIMVVVPWTQSFADQCERMWADLKLLRDRGSNAVEVTYMHHLPLFEDSALSDWMEEGDEFDRQDAYWDGGFFSPERPPLPNMDGCIRGDVYLIASDQYISLRVFPHHEVMHEADGVIYRRSDELFTLKS